MPSPSPERTPSAQAENIIEVDADHEQADSTYGDDHESFTTSLTSSVMAYKFEYGRRFHAYKEGSYRFPNDEEEQDRLDMFHEVCKMLTEGVIAFAPFKKEGRILDLGTGTGIWAIEAGDEWPASTVLGNDLSPIQPRWTPPNVKFEVDDIESDWAYSTPFDFIHSRYLVCSISDWPRLVRQAFSNLKPGGYAEFQDWNIVPTSDDGSATEDNKIIQLQKLVVEATQKIGKEPVPGPKLKNWMEEAGYVNVTERVFKMPLGMWPKDQRLKKTGACSLMSYLDGLEAMTYGLLPTVLGWKIEEVQVLLAEVRKEARRKDVHMYYDCHFVYGQKPEE
ncbi:Methyltransferase type 11 [Lasiodiplodia theobromae]|uniref:Secondary metabolism regulator laeA n=1 Tax=Lasiodiplodia theobromae TaxID=45133 RepID=A0A5N5DDR9_9PEZI|nr:Methyltransferase type 11 [Lasiodiplodia theobromae]KAB2575292.1 Secondary metabolism regulator laeA [Lasiodiplodia theobromae]KAF4539485.1 Methyltransferase type 11 [Lasiodiplodia theobromae]